MNFVSGFVIWGDKRKVLIRSHLLALFVHLILNFFPNFSWLELIDLEKFESL